MFQYETEGNRLQIESDSVIDCDAMEVSFRGEVNTTPQRDGGAEVPTTIGCPFRRRWLHVHGFYGDCWEHGFGGFACASTSYTNIAPPFLWYVNGNLVRILTGDPKDDETDHCIGLVWSEGGSINLYDYLADCCKPFADKFSYVVNGSPCGVTLEFGNEPEEFHPKAFHVELRDEDGIETLDRMWVVVNATATKNNYRRWYARYASTSWVSTLPKPYAKLQISTNWLGIVSATPANPLHPNTWYSPSKVSGYLHHASKWEMRSKADADGHGNQACYDDKGTIVLSGIAGGTADYFSGTIETVSSHVAEDVNPYLNALHLDGNPGDTGWFNGISRPCLYQGEYLDQYIERRPIVQPEGE